MRKLLLFGLLTISLTSLAQTTLVPYNSSWKYLDNGSNQGTNWRNTFFNDAAWATGNAQLGYGDGDEATVVSYGPNSKKKYITTYFRKTISIADISQFNGLTLNIKRDDGAVVYINGTERFRTNMPTGTISNTTKASSEAGDDGNTPQTISLSPSFFVSGTNVIAVEVHLFNANNADMSFDLQLSGNSGFPTATLTRGPYLQMVNQNAATLRWRTDVATDSKIEVGTAFGSYTLSSTNPASTTEHEVRITGLDTDTKYFYRFGSSTQVLQAANSNYFNTAPPETATRKIRIAAFGDCGRNDNGFQAGTLSAYQSFVGSNPAELLMLLGDNAYDAGLDAEYTSRFFGAYGGNILKNHALFPAPGNHDYANNSTRQNDHNVPYYSIFSLPSNGECGGVASNTEAFYSYNWGNIHFLSLDSYGRENNATRLYDTTGPQVQWIKNDLAANTKKWTIAYWHHPPYTMGSHNSDTESELISIRNNFIRILERYGVDMIICGHSHDYERSYLLKGHYGSESTFNASTHAVSNSSGKYNGTANSCPYTTVSGQVEHGTVYVVAGSAGADGGIQAGYPHNAMPFSVDDGGMMYLEIEDNRLDARFIRRDGSIADNFTIVKDTKRSSNYTISAGGSVDLTASWVGSYNWNSGETTRTITVSPLSTTTYIVNDAFTCLSDTFNVTVETTMARGIISKEVAEANAISIIPSLVKRGETITIKGKIEKATEFVITDAHGKTMKKIKGSTNSTIDTGSLTPGVYFVKWINNGKARMTRFVVVN
jgi:acid phosphatase type 7